MAKEVHIVSYAHPDFRRTFIPTCSSLSLNPIPMLYSCDDSSPRKEIYVGESNGKIATLRKTGESALLSVLDFSDSLAGLSRFNSNLILRLGYTPVPVLCGIAKGRLKGYILLHAKAKKYLEQRGYLQEVNSLSLGKKTISLY